MSAWEHLSTADALRRARALDQLAGPDGVIVGAAADHRDALRPFRGGDDMAHAPRRWTTSPPFDGLDAEIPDGAPMDHPLFPMLWTRADGLVAKA
mgnify:CR=1 FL=1